MSKSFQPRSEQVIINHAPAVTISDFESRQIIITTAAVDLEPQANTDRSREVVTGPSAEVQAVQATNQSTQLNSASNVEERSNLMDQAVASPTPNVEAEPGTSQRGRHQAYCASNVNENAPGSSNQDISVQKLVICIQHEGPGTVNINIGTYGTNNIRMMSDKEARGESRELEISRAADSSSDTKSSNREASTSSSYDSSTSSGDTQEDADPEDQGGDSSSTEDERHPNGCFDATGALGEARHDEGSQEDDHDDNKSQGNRRGCSESRGHIACNANGNRGIVTIDASDSFEVEL